MTSPEVCAGQKHDYSEYAHGKCSCDVGRAAKAAYMSARRKRATANRRAGVVVPHVHGKRSGFEELGCTHPLCRKAHRDSRPK